MPDRKPKRVQRKRGVPLPKGAKYVGRPTKWGNPFRVKPDPDCGPDVRIRKCLSIGEVDTNEAAVELYRWWLKHTPEGRAVAHDAQVELRGKDLACWCSANEPCHADVLLEIANS